MRSFAVSLLPPVAVGLFALVAYLNAMPPVAVHDDKFFVPSVFHLDRESVAALFREDAWGAAGAPAGRYRPLLLLTFATDRALFGQDLRGYHLTNVVVHLATTLALYFLLAAVLGGSGSNRTPSRLAAAAAAIVFGVHPIHTEAVDSVFNRSEMLVALATVAALGVLLRWERDRSVRAWSLVCVLFFAALLVRENAAILPALLVGFVWLLHPELDWRERFWRVAPVVTLGLTLVVYLLMRQAALARGVQTMAPSLAENLSTGGLLADRLALYVTTMREYLRMMVWPHPLRSSYEDFAPSAVAAAVVLHVAVIAATALAWRRSPWIAFGVGFFYLALLPSTRLLTETSGGSGFLAQPATGLILCAERTTYLPSAGLAFPLAVGFAALGRRLGQTAVVVSGLALAALFIPITRARNVVWHSERTLWEAEVKVAPENGDAWRLLTGTYVGHGIFDETTRICDRELPAHPRLVQLANNCGIAYQAQGRFVDAEGAYRHAIDGGLEAVGHANLARLYDRMGRPEDARQEYLRAIETEQEPGRRHFRRGQMLLRFHPDRLAEAEAEFRDALEILPHWSAARSALEHVRSLRARGS